MTPRELFVPAKLTKIHTYEPAEVRKVVLTLPETYEVDGRLLPIQDRMHPGSAFLARPYGQRTGKYRRRMYTRSNCSVDAPRALETIVNDTHREKADTSPWWQSEAISEIEVNGGTIDVRVDFNEQADELVVYENSQKVQPNNLILEPDDVWPTMRFLALSFSTGITPFLAHLRYMRERAFGRSSTCPGVEFTLVATVRNPRQLMEHEELLEMARTAPDHVHYHPVLTREWPEDWPYTKGRVMTIAAGDGPESSINLEVLLGLVSNIGQCHVRFCGNTKARDQLTQGLRQLEISPLSFRGEVW